MIRSNSKKRSLIDVLFEFDIGFFPFAITFLVMVYTWENGMYVETFSEEVGRGGARLKAPFVTVNRVGRLFL